MYPIKIKAVLTGLVVSVFLFQSNIAHSQERLDLDKCIEIALQNNISVKKEINSLQESEIQEKQAHQNYLPSVNARANYTINYGTDFDDATGSLGNDTKSSNLSLDGELTLFNGMQNYYNVLLRKSQMESSRYGVAAIKDQIKVQVISYYLAVLASNENIKVTNERINLLNDQLGRANKRVELGVDNMEQVYNLKSQIASEKLTLVKQKNQLEQERLQLFQTLMLDPRKEYLIGEDSIIDESITQNLEVYENIVDSSLSYSPRLKAYSKAIESYEYNVGVIKSQRLPTLLLVGGITSRYSSLDPMEVGPQFDKYRSEYIGLNLSIPLFNKFQNKNNISRSKLTVERSRLDYDQAQLEVLNNIQKAYLDVVTAQNTFIASQENLSALDQSFKFAEASYNNGKTDFYTYIETLNKKNRAEIELVNAKIDFTYKKKILEVYKGAK